MWYERFWIESFKKELELQWLKEMSVREWCKTDLRNKWKTSKPQIIKEFPATAQAHGFNDLVDNYAGYATLYRLEGSLNGVAIKSW